VVVAADLVDFGAQVSDGEPVGFRGERDDGVHDVSGSFPVDIDPTDPGVAGHRRQVHLVEDAVGDERDVDAVQHGAELVHHLAETLDDVTEVVKHPAGVQCSGVVADRFEAQHVFAFRVALQRQATEVDLEDRQVVRRCLDHSRDPR
jgi:hypothetical protein